MVIRVPNIVYGFWNGHYCRDLNNGLVGIQMVKSSPLSSIGPFLEFRSRISFIFFQILYMLIWSSLFINAAQLALFLSLPWLGRLVFFGFSSLMLQLNEILYKFLKIFELYISHAKSNIYVTEGKWLGSRGCYVTEGKCTSKRLSW